MASMHRQRKNYALASRLNSDSSYLNQSINSKKIFFFGFTKKDYELIEAREKKI